MYCPSCSQHHNNGFTRCPECHGLLKQEALEQAPDKDDDWSTPWGSKMDQRPRDLTPEHETQVLETESALEDSEAWLDTEFEDEVEEGLSPTGTVYVGSGGNSLQPSTNTQLLFLGVVALFCLVSLGVLVTQIPGQDPSAPTPQAAHKAQSDAERWLQNAQESLQQGDYELASSQLRKGIQLLEETQASPAELEKARLELGHSLTQEGQLEQAHDVLSRVKLSEQTASEVAALEKSLRVQGNELLSSARAKLSTQPSQARAEAQKALRLFQKYKGQKTQLAQAYELIGKSHLAENNKSSAAMAYRSALDAEYTAERQQTLNRLAPPRRSYRSASAERRPKLELDSPGSRVPKAEPRRPSYQEYREPERSRQEPRVQLELEPEQTSTAARPVEVRNQPIYQPNYEEDRPGGKDVLPGYDSSGQGSSGLPGY